MLEQIEHPDWLVALKERLAQLDAQREEQIKQAENKASADRQYSLSALRATYLALSKNQIESGALFRLCSEIQTIHDGAQPSGMLKPPGITHRRPKALMVQDFKGRFAAIMEDRQHKGRTRKEARAWVMRQMPASLRKIMGAASGAAIDAWLLQFGGDFGPSGPGRNGYLRMKEILSTKDWSDEELSALVADDFLPSLSHP